MLIFLIQILRVLLTFTRPLSKVFFNVVHRIIFGRNKPLPPIRNKILFMSATQLAENIRKRKISAEDVMRVYINRIKEVNPIINAIVDQRFEMALADARAVDKMLQNGKRTDRELAQEMPLLGVPFSCKESVGVQGLSQSNGLLCAKGRKSDSNAEVVMKYKKAGAIPLVVTNVPTVCMWWETSNLVFGRTMNPYDNRRTSGGSTGGEAALLASAGSVIGIGTDIGGSIRIPSAFCGIYGHKPSRGIISNHKTWVISNKKYEPLQTTGPVCRYAEDLNLLVHILSGEDSQKLRLREKVDFAKVKIYYMEELPGCLFSATPDIKAAVKKAVRHFQKNFGSTAIKLNLEEMRYAFDIWQFKFVEAAGPPLRKGLTQIGGEANWYWELIKSMFGCAAFDFPIIFFAAVEKGEKDKYYYKCLEVYENLRSKLKEILTENAIFLVPTHPEPAPHIMTTIPKLENIGYTCIFNVLGYPATAIPAGMSEGVPIGLQAVAGQNYDRLTLAAAKELEKVFSGWKCPSLIEV